MASPWWLRPLREDSTVLAVKGVFAVSMFQDCLFSFSFLVIVAFCKG